MDDKKYFTPPSWDWDLATAAATSRSHMTNVRFPAFYATRVSRKKIYEEIYLMAAILYSLSPLSRGQCCNGGMTWVDSSRHAGVLFSFHFIWNVRAILVNMRHYGIHYCSIQTRLWSNTHDFSLRIFLVIDVLWWLLYWWIVLDRHGR